MGMHVNPVTEVCLCLSGEALLHAGDIPYRLRPPGLCVIPNGIRHS
jgi:quercetin dioxygenase-like cupin family protein